MISKLSSLKTNWAPPLRFHNPLIRLVVITTVLAVQGCIPSPVRYWAPSADGAKTVNTHCGTAAAPASTLEFSFGKVTLRVDGQETYTQLELFVPTGSSAFLKDINAHVSASGITQSETVSISVARYYDFSERKWFEKSPLQSMEGHTRRHALGTEARSYIMSIKYPNIRGEEFSLTLPSVIADGVESKPVTILFRKTNGFGIFPINC